MLAPEYHKIDSVFKRDMAHPKRPFLMGQWSRPEFETLAEGRWYFTEKVDGTNIRLTWDGNRLLIGGRTYSAQLLPSLIAKIRELLPEEKLREKFDYATPDYPVWLYGEGYGAKIQKGGGDYLPNGQSFILFDVHIGKWLEQANVEDVAGSLGLKFAPVVFGVGTLFDAIEHCKKGFQSCLRKTPPEGLVCRPTTQLFDWKGNRIITKVKLKDFVKEEEQ